MNRDHGNITATQFECVEYELMAVFILEDNARRRLRRLRRLGRLRRLV